MWRIQLKTLVASHSTDGYSKYLVSSCSTHRLPCEVLSWGAQWHCTLQRVPLSLPRALAQQCRCTHTDSPIVGCICQLHTGRGDLPREPDNTFIFSNIKAQTGVPNGGTGEEKRQSQRIASSQKGLNIDFQGAAGHRQLKLGDNIRMKDPKLPDALTLGKNLSTSPREEGRTWKTERKISTSSGKTVRHLTLKVP